MLTQAMLSEFALFHMARLMYRSDLCHSYEMKDALSSPQKYRLYRASRCEFVMDAAKKYGVSFRDKDVLDFGCGDGALTLRFLDVGSRSVTGVDVDHSAIEAARTLHRDLPVEFITSTPDQIPIQDNAVDTVVSFDVFEHVTHVKQVIDELHRILRSGGRALIGTWGWYHPFAAHLFSTMPVPWAHVFFSENTLLRVSRRVFESPWFVPTMNDVDENGAKLADRYLENEIPCTYVNKLLIRDFERLFRRSEFDYKVFPIPFTSPLAGWTRIFFRSKFLREFVTAYLWVVLHKQ